MTARERDAGPGGRGAGKTLVAGVCKRANQGDGGGSTLHDGQGGEPVRGRRAGSGKRVCFPSLFFNVEELCVKVRCILHRKGTEQTQTALLVGKYPNNQGPTFDLLLELLKHVGQPQMLVISLRQPVERQRLFDIVFNLAVRMVS